MCLFPGTEGDKKSILIECKDFDPNSTGKVGITFVDALDSKSKDLGIDYSIICSNAGFTEDAIKKAARLGIGIVSILRKGDARIRFLVKEEIFTRKIRIEKTTINLLNDGKEIDLSVERDLAQILAYGLPLAGWISSRISLIVASNPIVYGQLSVSNHLIAPIKVQISGRDVGNNTD